jgi:NhaP-type Na+/H+ or K+/H+ antiporter
MESTPEVLTTWLLLTMVAIIIIAGSISSKIAQRIKLPDVVLYIFAGVLLGPNFFNVLKYDNSTVNQVILTFGAAYILFDGGREIRLKVLNKIKYSVTSLATLGVLVSAFITSFFAQKFLHLDPLYAFLLGSVIASTDPSVLVPLFKKMDISPKLKQTIIAESAFNDACGAIVTFAVLGIIAGGKFSIGENAFELLKTSVGGIIVGLIVGFVAVYLVTDHKRGLLSDFPTEIAVAAVIGAYEIGTYFGVSGFMAVFVLGIVAGNKKRLGLRIADEPFETHIHFKEALISILRMMIFILLGVHMDLAVLSEYWLGSLLTVAALIFIARPISVFVSVAWDRSAKWTWQEIVYLMWVRETGVIPAALVGMLVTMKVPHADVISAVTFMTILITLALQASTKGFIAHVLKLDVNPKVAENTNIKL